MPCPNPVFEVGCAYDCPRPWRPPSAHPESRACGRRFPVDSRDSSKATKLKTKLPRGRPCDSATALSPARASATTRRPSDGATALSLFERESWGVSLSSFPFEPFPFPFPRYDSAYDNTDGVSLNAKTECKSSNAAGKITLGECRCWLRGSSENPVERCNSVEALSLHSKGNSRHGRCQPPQPTGLSRRWRNGNCRCPLGHRH